jgi:hypothetical protein
LEGLVVVEMFGGDVGDYPSVEITSQETVLVEAMGGDFEDEVGDALVGDFSEEFLKFERVWRGDVEAGVDVLVVDFGGDSGDKGGLVFGGFEKVVDDGGCGSFAVGACDSDDGEMASWVAVDDDGQEGDGEMVEGVDKKVGDEVAKTAEEMGVAEGVND